MFSCCPEFLMVVTSCPLTCFLWAAHKKYIIFLIRKVQCLYQVLMLQVICLIYIWIIINSKDENSQASVIWKCSFKLLVILDWLGLLWTPKVRSTKARGNKLKHVGAGPDGNAGGRCSDLLYRPASLLFTASERKLCLCAESGCRFDNFAECCPTGQCQ